MSNPCCMSEGLLSMTCSVGADPYFSGLSQPGREPSAQPVSKLSFEFERRKLTTDEVRCAAE